MKLVPLLVVLISAYLTPASAIEPFKLGEVGFAGSGCPATTDTEQSTIIRLNENAISIILTEMTLLTSPLNRTFQRKKCDIALSVTVSSGYQIGIGKAKLHTFVSLDDDSKATVSLFTGFAGSEFKESTEKFTANTFKNAELSIDEKQWAACGQDMIIRAKASATIRGTHEQDSYLKVNGLFLSIVYRACSNG